MEKPNDSQASLPKIENRIVSMTVVAAEQGLPKTPEEAMALIKEWDARRRDVQMGRPAGQKALSTEINIEPLAA